jgi:hypothetical protein
MHMRACVHGTSPELSFYFHGSSGFPGEPNPPPTFYLFLGISLSAMSP